MGKNESNDNSWLEYHYGKSVLEIGHDGSLYGFQLRSGDFGLQYEGCEVKMGDSLAVLATGYCCMWINTIFLIG